MIVRGRLESEGRTRQIAIQKHVNMPIRVRCDARNVKHMSEITALLPLQVFQPNVAELIFGRPQLRREWLDWGVFHTQTNSAATFRSFRQGLHQRNAALRVRDIDTVRAFQSNLGTAGQQITSLRYGLLNSCTKLVAETTKTLLNGIEIELKYEKGFSAESYADELERTVERDLAAGITQSGPQRADLRISITNETVTERDVPAAVFLSRGQGKALAASLKFAQVLLLSRSAAPAVLLIDDLDAEFDEAHMGRLLALIGGTDCQVFAATAKPRVLDVVRERLENVDTRHFELNRGQVVAH